MPGPDSSETCCLCMIPTSSTCTHCGTRCCPAHLSAHRVGTTCLPFSVTFKEGVGRCVVAARDISALEEILRDCPAMVGPYFDENPLCLECLLKTDGSICCPVCDLPLCGPHCQAGPNHKFECQFFTELQKTVAMPKNAPNTPYLITILRLLNVRDSNPAMWDRLGMLMDHKEEQEMNKESWDNVQTNIVGWLRTKGGLADQFSAAEITRAIGLIRTNGINIEKPYAGQMVSCKALYPTFSFLSHSCISNARIFVMADNEIVIRAQVDIKQGEEITIQYISYLFGNILRRKDILENWMFECCCPRCVDPTELGSHLSSLVCSACAGTVLPATCDIDCQVWKCQSCGQKLDRDAVEQYTKECEGKMMQIYETEADKYESMLVEYSKIFHQNHFQILLIKKYLARALKGKMTKDQIKRKLSLMKEFMNAFQLVDPGYTKWRGMMTYEASKISMFLADMDLSQGNISQEAFINVIEQAVADLETAANCLKFEPEGTEEAHCAKQATASLRQAQEVLHFSKFCKIK